MIKREVARYRAQTPQSVVGHTAVLSSNQTDGLKWGSPLYTLIIRLYTCMHTRARYRLSRSSGIQRVVLRDYMHCTG